MLFSSTSQASYYGLECSEYAEKENKKPGGYQFLNAKLIRGRCDYKTQAMHYTMQLPVGQSSREQQKSAIMKFMNDFKPIVCTPQHNTWNLVDLIIFEFFDENERFMYSYQVNREECVY